MTTQRFFRPRLSSLLPATWVFLLVFLTWATPTMVGLWTQIRKGLPRFARAPRTIVAAANYEAHRMTFAAIAAIVVLAIDLGLRLSYVPTGPGPGATYLGPIMLTVVGLWLTFTACGWIGPLRSDFTDQLVRSRWHAARIIVMYACIIPVIVTVASGFAVSMLARALGR